MYALFGTNTFYRSIPIPDTGDENLLGTGFNELTTRPVCEALARHDIRWAIDSPHVYRLDRPERSSGLFDLASVDGLEKVRVPWGTTPSTGSPPAASTLISASDRVDPAAYRMRVDRLPPMRSPLISRMQPFGTPKHPT